MSWVSRDALRCAEMSWDALRWAEMSWDELRWAEMRWDALRWAEMHWGELRWAEMSWGELRWAEMSWDELSEPRCAEMRWDELRCAEMSWDELRWAEMSWDALRCAEMSWDALKWAEMSWDELRWAEVSWDALRWAEMHWGELRWAEVSWGELRWAGWAKIFNLQFLRDVSRKMRFWEVADARNRVFCSKKRASENGWGRSAARRVRDGLGFARIILNRPHIGAVGSGFICATLKSCSFEGCLERRVRFQSFNFQFLRDVSYESLVLTTSTFSFWGMSRTKASFSRAQLSVFEGCLARKLSFHKLNFQFLRDASHESFVFTTSAFSLWVRSRAKTSFSQLQLPELKEVLQLRFHKWKLLFNCAKVAAMSLCRFFSFLEPFIFLFLKLQNRTFWALAPGFGFGAGFLGQRRVEMIWEWKGAEKSWDEVRRADTRWEAERRWDELRRSENNSEELRTEGGRDEKTWHVLTWAAKSWGRVEKRWDNPRRGEITWGEMTWDELRRPDMRRWWRAEKSCVETSCVEWRNWEAERSWSEKSSDEVRRDEKA